MTIDASIVETDVIEPDVLIVDIPEYEIPSFVVPVINVDENASEKVRAIMTRIKPRDLFDFWFLIKAWKVRFDEDLVNLKLSIYKKTFSPILLKRGIALLAGEWKKQMKNVLFIRDPGFDACASVVWKWATGTAWSGDWVMSYGGREGIEF